MRNRSFFACLVLAVVATFAGLHFVHAVGVTGVLPQDTAGRVIQCPTLAQFGDGAGTPVVSPKASVGTNAQAFTVPTGAVYMVFNCTANSRYGTNATLDGSTVAKGYKVAIGGIDCRVPCAGSTAIYIRAESGTVTVDFLFEVIQ